MNRARSIQTAHNSAIILLLVAICLLAPARALHAQLPPLDPCSAGRSYIIAYPDTTQNGYDNRFASKLDDRFYLLLYTTTDSTHVTINEGGLDTERVILKAGKFKELRLRTELIVNGSGSKSNRIYRIDADNPIIVYCYMMTQFGGEAWTPAPVEAWGTKYYAAAIPPTLVEDIFSFGEDNYGMTDRPAPAEFLILAAYDSTHVTVYPNAKMIGLYTATLNAGQTYQLKTDFDWPTKYSGKVQPDPGGSYIVADRPIAVISGNTRHSVDYTQKMLATNSIKTMLIEWLTPIDQQGTEFAFLPSMDSHRPGGANPEQRRKGDYVRIYGTQGVTTSGTIAGDPTQPPIGFTVPDRGVKEFMITPAQARYIKTDRPAQVMMHTAAASKFDSTFVNARTYAGQSYTGWGPYMVEMIAREQWTSFAPFYAPDDPYGMEQYVNVVADASSQNNIYMQVGTAPRQLFNFNQGVIPGSNLVWGTMQLAAGTDYYINGTNGARFSGMVYGFWRGFEQFRPGNTRKKGDGDPSIASGGGGDQILHPSEYEENTAISYGYPFPPSRCPLLPPGIRSIDSVMGCTDLSVRVNLASNSTAGIHSIVLDQAATQNARLVYVTPNSASQVSQFRGPQAEVRMTPIDPSKDAFGSIIIQDGSRNGRTYTVGYRYYAERLQLGAAPGGVVDFGLVLVNTSVTIPVLLTNPTGKTITVDSAALLLGDQGFQVDHTLPPLPAVLKPGEQIRVWLKATPEVSRQVYRDTLRMVLGCTETRIPVQMQGSSPCIQMGDLDFGTLGTGESKSMQLTICNQGNSPVSFYDSTGKGVLTWLETSFTVSAADMALLKATVLDSGKCVTITVTFTSAATGVFTTTARAWANSRDCRDTSVWRAVVTKPGPQISGYDWKKRWLTTRNSCTESGIAQYDTVIVISNNGSQPFTVAKIELTGADAVAGNFVLGASPAVTAGTVVAQGDSVRQQVLFLPDAERAYSCVVKLTTDKGEEVPNILAGTGIESHVQITGMNFGDSQFRGAGTTSIPASVTLTALPTRRLQVRELRITGANPGEFAFDLSGGFVPPVESNPATWLNLDPGESRQIPLLFVPLDSGSRSATIEVIGDHSRCDDSTGALAGHTFRPDIVTGGFTFGSILSCDDSTGFVTVTNGSPVPVRIVDIAFQNPSENHFAVDKRGLPGVLPAGAIARFPVTFTPGADGNYSAIVVFTITDTGGALNIGPLTATVEGSGHSFTANAHIDRSHRAFPGTTITVPVQLDQSLDGANVTGLTFSLTYDAGMLLLANGGSNDMVSMLQGTRLQGWNGVVTAASPGSYSIHLTSPGAPLQGTGTLLNLQFLTFVGDVVSSDLPFTIALDSRPCASVNASPGAVQLDSVCGLGLRLIEASGTTYTLDQNNPNPFNPTTDINFSLGLDGHTTLTVYNAIGERVATLVSGYMVPGSYRVRWDATAMPSGLYYYRLNSGNWSRTNTMILRK